jgi:hypothetical protein
VAPAALRAEQASPGTYTIDGESVTVDQTSGTSSQAGGTHDFCVKGDTLTMSDGGNSQLVFTRQ